MPVATQVSVDEYLHTSYDPDRDYIDGEVVERLVGEFEHSRSQSMSAALLVGQEKKWGTLALTEQRVQVTPTRYRIPDVCVLAPGAPRERIIRHPPLLCIEILSKEDTMSDIMERVEEYLGMGVPYVWVIDPWRHRGYCYTSSGMAEAKDGVLRTSNPDLEVPLAALFD
jgi:Uma2 family endonuclease